MRQFSILVVVIVFCLSGSRQSLAQDKIVLPVTYSATNANMLSLWVGKDAGYFDEQGLDVRMLLIRGGSLAVQLLVTGQSPIGLIGGTSAAHAYLQGTQAANGSSLELTKSAAPREAKRLTVNAKERQLAAICHSFCQ